MQTGQSRLRFQFEGEVWVYRTNGAVYFVSLPKEMSAEILDLIGNSLNSWGTVPCDATTDDFTWYTSMFPRKDRNCYDLPLNAKVRKRLKLEDGQVISVTIEVPLPL